MSKEHVKEALMQSFPVLGTRLIECLLRDEVLKNLGENYPINCRHLIKTWLFTSDFRVGKLTNPQLDEIGWILFKFLSGTDFCPVPVLSLKDTQALEEVQRLTKVAANLIRTAESIAAGIAHRATKEQAGAAIDLARSTDSQDAGS